MTTASERWATDLESWAIPQELLDAVPESPYGWPAHLWKRRTMVAESQDETVTTRIALASLGGTGTLLDVGAGTGRASLPIAGQGHEITAVEPNGGMAAGLREEAARTGLEVAVIEAPWPEAEPDAGSHDVVLSANVVYDVPRIGPFVAALQRCARRGVVIEMTTTHPWSSLRSLFLEMHGLERPVRPTVDDLIDVIGDVVGVVPEVELWSRPGNLYFENEEEVLDLYQRRLVLPPDRRPELAALLRPDLTRTETGWFVGLEDRELATLWWGERAPG